MMILLSHLFLYLLLRKSDTLIFNFATYHVKIKCKFSTEIITMDCGRLRKLILPLIMEQLLAVSVGMADTFMVSTVGEAAIFFGFGYIKVSRGYKDIYESQHFNEST